ncbi:MAG: response regulator, partial [Ignavibacteriales bacterium]|nr:response regulator [Ignavibacteriales bacterium]
MSNHSISILAADDEESFLDLLRKVLEAEEYTVETAIDGVAAINKLQSKAFDLVLCDVKMPRVDGLEVLKFVKDHYMDTQVIMLTGVNDIGIAVDCMRLGAYHYLTKPYSA